MTVSKSQALEIWNMANQESRKEILELASENQFSKLPVEAFKSKINSSFSSQAKLIIVNLVRKWVK